MRAQTWASAIAWTRAWVGLRRDQGKGERGGEGTGDGVGGGGAGGREERVCAGAGVSLWARVGGGEGQDTRRCHRAVCTRRPAPPLSTRPLSPRPRPRPPPPMLSRPPQREAPWARARRRRVRNLMALLLAEVR